MGIKTTAQAGETDSRRKQAVKLHPSLKSASSSQELMTAVKDLVLGMISQAEGVLVMLDSEQGLVVRGARGLEPEVVLRPGSPGQRAIEKASAGAFVRANQRLAVPIRDAQGVFRGVLYVENGDGVRPFGPACFESLRKLALQVGEVLTPQQKPKPGLAVRRRRPPGLFLILFVVIALAWVWWQESSTPIAIEAGIPLRVQLEATARELLSALQSQNPQAARAFLQSDLRARTDVQQLHDPGWKSFRIAEARGSGQVRLANSAGQTRDWSFTFEHGRWRLADFGPR